MHTIKYRIDLIIFIQLVVLIYVTSSCNKESKRVDYLPQYMKNSLPYVNGQNLLFVGTNNETLQLKVECRKGLTEVQGNCPTCPFDVESVYYDFYTQNQSTQDKWMSLYIEPDKNFGYPIAITVNSLSALDNFVTGDTIYVYFNRATESLFCNGLYCHDSIEINSKKYYKVIECFATGNDMKVLFYNSEKGVLQIEYNNGVKYYLSE